MKAQSLLLSESFRQDFGESGHQQIRGIIYRPHYFRHVVARNRHRDTAVFCVKNSDCAPQPRASSDCGAVEMLKRLRSTKSVSAFAELFVPFVPFCGFILSNQGLLTTPHLKSPRLPRLVSCCDSVLQSGNQALSRALTCRS
jgi:hypothetical protein